MSIPHIPATVNGRPTRMYRKWASMKGRCCRKSHPAYPWYGAKGVKVCERWKDSFQHFLSDMGECPDGYWIDRIDNTKGYEPGNCRWITPKQSANNRGPRRPDTKSLRNRAKIAGLPYMVVYQRIHRLMWDEARSLSTPVAKRGPRLFGGG